MGHNNLIIIPFVQRRNTNSILDQEIIPDFRVRNSDSPGFSQVPIPYPISCGRGLGSLSSSHMTGRGPMVIDSCDLWLQDGDRKSPPKTVNHTSVSQTCSASKSPGKLDKKHRLPKPTLAQRLWTSSLWLPAALSTFPRKFQDQERTISTCSNRLPLSHPYFLPDDSM